MVKVSKVQVGHVRVAQRSRHQLPVVQETVLPVVVVVGPVEVPPW